MRKETYSDELEVALARPDVDRLCQNLDAYIGHLVSENDGEWPDEHVDTFGEIISGVDDDPERALAYVVLASSRTDDAGFLALMGCGPLEDLLRDPSDQLLQRVVAEGRRSDRFRWLLSHPFKVSIAPRAWAAIEKFRITGPHEEPSDDTLPPRG